MHRILVIDDDHHILLMIKKMLERAGFEVDLAANGDEGLELFKKLSVDLVITDIIMPEKEGLETIREMKRLRSDLKIIAMSGGGKVSSDNYLNLQNNFIREGLALSETKNSSILQAPDQACSSSKPSV